ncbi:hypothetical protein BHM03_00054234, partial [Ensete ventricosum]
FQSAFFTIALLSSSIVVASHSSPPAATSAAAPPNRRAPVPQRSLLPATPSSAPTHNIITFASCCCIALVPLPIAAVAPICCLQPHPTGHPCHLPLQPLQPTVTTSFPQLPPLLLHPSTTIAPLLLVAHALYRYLIAATHTAASSSLASSRALLCHRNHLLPVPHPPLSQPLPAAALCLLCFLPYRSRFQLAIPLLSLPLPLSSASSSSPVVALAIPCRCFLWLFHPSLALLGRCSIHLPLLPSSFSSQPSIVPSPSTVATAPACRCCLLFNRSLSHLYHRRCSLSNLSLATATVVAPPTAHPSSTNASSAAVSPASLALNRAFLPPHLHHHRCQLPDPVLPNLFPAAAAITSHNHCPSPISSSASSIAIAANPYRCHLSSVTTATRLCLLPCRCYPRCHSHFQSRPCRCTSLLPPLQHLATTVAPTISNQLFDILVILTSIISLRSSPTTSTMQTHAPDSIVEKRTEHH